VPLAAQSATFPVLYYLAGLTCNEDTGAWKGNFLAHAQAYGIALVFPDTSPRGANVEGEEDNWNLGTGASFYVDATASKWEKNYRMYTFLTQELPTLLKGLNLPLVCAILFTFVPFHILDLHSDNLLSLQDLNRQSIMGHSMGGMGALNLFLSTSQYRSASAFAPACNPTTSPWGINAFTNYLKGGIEEGEKYDPSCLLRKAKGRSGVNILIDYGDADEFYLGGNLSPEVFQQTADEAGFTREDVNIRRHAGYDHGYYFVRAVVIDGYCSDITLRFQISTFAEDHVKCKEIFIPNT